MRPLLLALLLPLVLRPPVSRRPRPRRRPRLTFDRLDPFIVLSAGGRRQWTVRATRVPVREPPWPGHDGPLLRRTTGRRRPQMRRTLSHQPPGLP